jgi:hypothetical protein
MGARTAPNYAGLRSWVRNVATGSTIAVYDGRAADLDTDGGRWQTVCETHSTIISHRTLALARSHAAAPADWCEGCDAR